MSTQLMSRRKEKKNNKKKGLGGVRTSRKEHQYIGGPFKRSRDEHKGGAKTKSGKHVSWLEYRDPVRYTDNKDGRGIQLVQDTRKAACSPWSPFMVDAKFFKQDKTPSTILVTYQDQREEISLGINPTKDAIQAGMVQAREIGARQVRVRLEATGLYPETFEVQVREAY